MSYDLEVLVTGRHLLLPVTIDGITVHLDMFAGYYKGRKRYRGTFEYMRQSKGVWCSLFEENKENWLFSAMNICDIKDADRSHVTYPFWEKRTEGMYVLTIRKKYRKAFVKCLSYLINKSPKKQIMFLPRLQGGEYNNVCGVIPFEKFIELLKNDKILFNIVYIIGK